MGQESFSTQVRINRFLGLNTKYSDLSIDQREATGLQNVNITDYSVETRKGSAKKHSTAFKDKTGATTKNITGLYETKLAGSVYRVGIGGDAFKEYSASAWTDRTGAVTITDSDNIHWSFATFKDSGGANDIIVAANGSNAPIKWTGSGNAAALSSPPGNFAFPVVHSLKLWVAVGDIVYFSAIRDGESWDTTNDIIRFENKGEDITCLKAYAGRLIVFLESAIYIVHGSSNRDLFVEKVVDGYGTKSGHTVKEVVSSRYGNILVFLSSDGLLRAFNGSKNLIDIGDPATPLFRSMSQSRLDDCVAGVYKSKNQYWLATALSAGTQNNQIIIYDFKNDYFSDQSGRPLSSILYHTGVNSNAMATWTENDVEILVTSNYTGFALKQDSGLLDEEVNPINGIWQGKKFDFGSPSASKMLVDLNLVTTQSTETNVSVSIVTDQTSCSGDVTIEANGSLWGTMVWGVDNWSSPATAYTRVEVSNNDTSKEDPCFGRYFVPQINHNSSSESMVTNELILGVTPLGDQAEFSE